MLDVVGFGALNFDRLCYVERIASPGEHQPVKEVYLCPGGSSANTIAWLANLGFKTGFIGAVGNDDEGKIVLQDFKKRKVDVREIKVLAGSTGVVTGFVDANGERALYPYPGVNDRLKLNKKTVQYASKSKFIHLSPFVSEKQLSEQINLVKKIPSDVKVSFSPGDLYALRGLEAIKPLLERTYVLFLNEDELRRLTWRGLKDGTEFLNSIGIEIVAVTLGKEGCYISTKDEKVSVPCRECTPVDTTGAGDSFCAGFLGGLLKNKGLEECGVLGNNLARECIRRRGARPR